MSPAVGNDATDNRLPVHLLTGFLGSGKTTLLNRLLARAALRDSAVVVNELGDVGLDHLLVERSDDQLVELAGGCLCCTVRGDLAQTLGGLLARRDAGDCPRFARIIIETTGLADPAPVMNLLATDQGLAERTRTGSIVTTVDAVNGADTLDRHPTAVKQVVLADRVLVTKSDLDALAAVRLGERLRQLNPRAEQLEVRDGRLPDSQTLFDDRAGIFDPARDPARDSNRDPGCDPVASPAQHLHGIETFTLARSAPVPGAALVLLVQVLAEQLGARLLRVKGLVRLAERPEQPAVLQGAQHVFHPLDFLPAWPDADRRTRLVFIVSAPARAWVEALFDALVREVDDTASRLRERS